MASWFSKARYGLFIHWGAYAVAGRGEWIMNRERIPLDEYRREFVDNFHAERYNPADWARLAVKGGMKYVVLTTKHLDGFCLWPSRTTAYNAARLGPRRDLIAPYVEALRRAGLKVGFYFSLADWSHPDYPIGIYHNGWPDNRWHDDKARSRFVKFFQSQLKELLTNYGKIDLLWFDGPCPRPLDGPESIAMVRKLQPDILINDRLGEPCDFHCSEQCLTPKEGLWEACITMGTESWGWHANEEWKTTRQVAESLVKTAKDGGNLLLNVGPKADGSIDEAMARPIIEAGEWLRRNPGWLEDSGRSPFSWFTSGHMTVKGSSVFCHLFRTCSDRFHVAGIGNKVKKVILLDGGRELDFEQGADGRIMIKGLPMPQDPVATVLRIIVEGKPKTFESRNTKRKGGRNGSNG